MKLINLNKMVTIILLSIVGGIWGYHSSSQAQQVTYNPTFTLDYQKCGSDPIITSTTVIFSNNNQCAAGRLVSNSLYKNISKITATIDLSKMSQNYVNASFYMISNPVSANTQPIGDNYCDAGGNNTQWNCREIDFIETNGNKITQTTMHLGDGGSNASQRYEYSFADTANTSCFNYNTMTGSTTSTNGLHSMVGIIDMSYSFEMVTTFTYGNNPAMKTVYSQNGKSVTVYDTNTGSGAEGSQSLNMSDLTTSMSNGYWLTLSLWQGYSPKGPTSSVWWNDSCSWGSECGSTAGYWTISNITVIAD